ncbi:hypothetical protein FGB62_57g09 [Gracilaria domingensis]|nr:hypothetical protein FGB62_57g09 [Gracilaria domingensis]
MICSSSASSITTLNNSRQVFIDPSQHGSNPVFEGKENCHKRYSTKNVLMPGAEQDSNALQILQEERGTAQPVIFSRNNERNVSDEERRSQRRRSISEREIIPSSVPVSLRGYRFSGKTHHENMKSVVRRDKHIRSENVREGVDFNVADAKENEIERKNDNPLNTYGCDDCEPVLFAGQNE